uniref:NADH-ubiquinone oxidoreductase chain 6 n=1 Tax=Gehyra marginata TaxID=1074251 RepID=A0A7R7J4U4_9SAUR|nr:NADH dehydrogenase subunit 6 [Gehyra marginata]
MTYLLSMMSVCFVVGMLGVAANPAPFYGAGGLLLGALGASGLMVVLGGSFIGLVLFLIYLGGMLVVIAYSVALAAEPYPETWGDWSVLVYVLLYFGFVVWVGWGYVELVGGGNVGLVGLDSFGLFNLRGDLSGVVLLYSWGGIVLLLGGWGLLVVLFVVLELVRGRMRGGLRMP